MRPRNLHQDPFMRLGLPGVSERDLADPVAAARYSRRYQARHGIPPIAGGSPAASAPITSPRRHGGMRPASADPPGVIVPFTAAAHEHTEQFLDASVTLGASAQQVGNGPIDVPAFGYLRNIYLEVSFSGGTLGAGALAADFPYNCLQSVALLDVNGAPIFGPMDGYAALWTNIIGGYAGRPDPRQMPGYAATINGTFFLRIPIEISHRNGYGALANQNAAAAYKLQVTAAPSTTAYSTAPTTPAAMRVRAYLEAWTLPNDQDVIGRQQAQLPPGHGTTQYWSYYTKAIAAGANTVLLPRVGNMIRAIGVIARQASGARQDNVFFDPASFVWDQRNLLQDTQNYRTNVFFERLSSLLARDTGVFAYDFAHSDHNIIGDDDPTLWLPTVQSTRLEIDGTAGAAGSLQILTNDVAPAEVAPDERFVETSDTGYRPQVGVSGPAVQ